MAGTGARGGAWRGGDGGIGRDEIAKLTLLDAVFQEAMRLYSPAPVLMRRTIAPVALDGIELDKGATIIIPIYVVHRHKLLWQDPLKFDPPRFAPEAPSLRLHAVRRRASHPQSDAALTAKPCLL